MEGSPPAQPPAPSSDAGSQYSAKPIPRLSGAGAPLTGTYNPQKVYVGNLPDTATLADLEDCFGQIGQCTCSIKRGFGFVEYLDAACAAEAVAKYHEGHFLGAQIKVELSHQRAAVPRPDEPKFPARNPPGSDRPSDARKPMFINGPPGPGRSRNSRHSSGGPTSGPYSGRPDTFAGPTVGVREPPRDRYGPPPRDMSGPPPPRGGPGPGPGPAPYGGPPGPDRFRDDYRSGGPPAPYSEPRYGAEPRYGGGGRDYDSGYGAPPPAASRDPRGPPPPPLGGGYNSAPPPLGRDARPPPFDPYYSAPRGGNDYAPYSAAPPGRPPYNAPPPPVPGYAPAPAYPGAAPSLPPPRDPYASDPYNSRLSTIPPPFDPLRGPPEPPRGYNDFNSRSPKLDAPAYDPRGPPRGGDDRSARYNPYGRPSPPRNGPSDPYSRGGPPERRRSLSPRRDDPYRAPYNAGPPPPPSNGGGYGPYNGGGGGYGAPRYGGPPADEPYRPR